MLTSFRLAASTSIWSVGSTMLAKRREGKTGTAGQGMTKKDGITRLTLAACQKIQAEMLSACRTIARGHGLIVEDVGSRNIHPGFGFEPVFRVSIPAPDGTAFNAEKEMFAVLAESYGLAPEDFGREFNTGHERFQITGIDPKRPKYPISAERIPDRQGFKFTAENVVALLKSQATS